MAKLLSYILCMLLVVIGCFLVNVWQAKQCFKHSMCYEPLTGNCILIQDRKEN